MGNRDDDLARIRATLAASEASALEDIVARLEPPIARRTLLRRLDLLVERGEVIKSGRSRAARYRLTEGVPRQPDAGVSAPIGPDAAAGATPEPRVSPAEIHLTPAALEIEALVTRPLIARQPVGYRREFLDAYRPNRTHYLTEAERQALHALGRTEMSAEAAGTYAQHIFNRLLIDLAWNSSRLEGNTYSLLDTKRLVELGQAAEGKSATDAQMIANHKRAIEFLVQSAGEVSFDRLTLLNLHALLSENLLSDPGSEGRLRTIPVGIAGSVYHPLALPQPITECFEVLLAKARAIEDPFEQALFAMVQLPYLQPFDDVNKRVSRLAANIPLIQRNLAPLSFVDVPPDVYTRAMLGVYELNRTELLKDVFIWACGRSAARYAAIQRSLGAPDPFRIAHRGALRQVISEVVQGGMDPGRAARHIEAFAAAGISASERSRFVEVAETELLALHEGNFARYQIRPSQFAHWQGVWRGDVRSD